MVPQQRAQIDLMRSSLREYSFLLRPNERAGWSLQFLPDHGYSGTIHMDDKPAIRKGETELPESRIFGNLLGLVTINALLLTY
jgi:hypothetical protein